MSLAPPPLASSTQPDGLAESLDASTRDPDLDFNAPLGAAQGVIAFSNIDDYHFSGEKCFFSRVYTGYKYQCVEYARRYCLITRGCVFAQVGPAADIFGLTSVTHVESGRRIPLDAHRNGETTACPAVGDVLIYPIRKKLPVGHVSIITFVAPDASFVGVAEQNFRSKSWAGQPYARTVPLKRDDASGRWTLCETHAALVPPLGWLRIDAVPREIVEREVTLEQLSSPAYLLANECPYGALRVLPRFVAAPADESATSPQLVRFHAALTEPSVPDATPDPSAGGAGDQSETRRSAIAAAYARTLERHFASHRGEADHHHVVQHQAPPTRRAGVKRTAKYGSIFSPNEDLSMLAITATARCFKIVEETIKSVLAPINVGSEDSGVEAQRLAAEFDMPRQFVISAARNVHAAQHSPLGALDSLLGTLAVVHDRECNAFKLLHAELDSLSLLIDTHLLQERYAADHGLQQGWRLTNFGHDFGRAVRSALKFRFGEKRSSAVVFLDFGSLEDLARHGVRLDAEAAYLYEVERWNALYACEYLSGYLVEKAREVSAGDLLAEDAPQWRLEKATFFDDETVVIDTSVGGVLLFHGERPTLLWKMAPWQCLFAALGQSPKLDAFMSGATAHSDRIFQPLWTHIASHPRFLPRASQWAEERDRSCGGRTGDSAALHTIPSECWLGASDADGRPACAYRVPCFDGVVDPPNPAREAAPCRATGESVSRGGGGGEDAATPATPHTAQHFAAIHSLVAGSKRSASLTLEGRTKDSQQTGCSIYDLVHPAPLCYMPFLRHDPHWHSTAAAPDEENEAAGVDT